MRVSSKMVSKSTPFLMASNTVNSRRSSMSRRRVSTSPSAGRFNVSMPISAPRTAFISAISNEGAMAMTSPVAFICVPSFRLALENLSNGQRGNLTTT